MRKNSGWLDPKLFLRISLGALAMLIIGFIVFDNYLVQVISGGFSIWIMILYAFLLVYYLYALIRASFLIRTNQSLYHVLTIVVCIFALFTVCIDKIMLDQITANRNEGLGFSGEQRMLLVSLLIKFLALLVAAIPALKRE